MRMLDILSGIGGFALAASWVWGDELEIVSFCEIDHRCREFLAKTWPGVPIHDDIKTLDATQWLGTVDLLVGGPPCQPASRAGKQRGAEDDRWLWPSALRVLEECQPTWVCFENPPGIRDVGLDGILSQMEGLGYEVGTVDIPACAVNAPQLRHRYWILAHDGSVGYGSRRTEPKRQRRKVKASESLQHLANGIGSGRGADLQEAGPGRRVADRGIGENTWADLAAKQESLGKEFEEVLYGNLDKLVIRTEGHMADPETTTRICLPNRKEPESPAQDGRCCTDQWGNHVWMPCADGKVRRAPDNSFGLVDGLQHPLSEMVGPFHRSILGALGNSIVPHVAFEIMRAIKEASQ